MPSFADLMKYEQAKWRREHLAPKPDEIEAEAEEVVEPVETEEDYEAMSRSDLYALAKSSGYTESWRDSSKDELVSFLNGE